MTIFIPKALEKRNTALFEKLVPATGTCDTLEGELLRAVNRIVYRYYNDGDYWYKGYGCETAGPAAAFLIGKVPATVKIPLAHPGLTSHVEPTDTQYEQSLVDTLKNILDFIEPRVKAGETTENSYDMLEEDAIFEPNYEEDDEGW